MFGHDQDDGGDDGDDDFYQKQSLYHSLPLLTLISAINRKDISHRSQTLVKSLIKMYLGSDYSLNKFICFFFRE